MLLVYVITFIMGSVIYFLCSELVVSEMDVSRTKICLDTSISATSNSERREYVVT